ncbi:hypothetical protein [Microbacterium sp.]|uniref:hypothetical protein n=1 Tax=Microbacterium sp. TaxID=51671 RepID=UPI003F6E9535
MSDGILLRPERDHPGNSMIVADQDPRLTVDGSLLERDPRILREDPQDQIRDLASTVGLVRGARDCSTGVDDGVDVGREDARDQRKVTLFTTCDERANSLLEPRLLGSLRLRIGVP